VAASPDLGNESVAKQILTSNESWALLAITYGNPINSHNAVSMQDLKDYLVKPKIMAEPTVNRMKTKLLSRNAIQEHNIGKFKVYTVNSDTLGYGIEGKENREEYLSLIQSRVFRHLFEPAAYAVIKPRMLYPHLLAGNMFNGAIINMALHADDKETKTTDAEDDKEINKMLKEMPSSFGVIVPKIMKKLTVEFRGLDVIPAEEYKQRVKKVGQALMAAGARQLGLR